jgi:hypothetical protein
MTFKETAGTLSEMEAKFFEGIDKIKKFVYVTLGGN